MENIKQNFQQNGYIIIKNFFSKEKINAALDEYKTISISFQEDEFGEHYFSTSPDNSQSSDKYFFDSAHEIRPFFNSLLK